MYYNVAMAMVKDTLKYLKKSFWVLALNAVVPALIISFFAQPFANITFLSMLFVGQTDYYFTDIFMMMLTPISGASFIAGFVGYIAFFIFFWLGCAGGICIVEKHLKTGELSPLIGKHQFFSYLFPVLIGLAIWAVLFLVSTVAQSGLISLIHFICGQTPPSFWDCFFSTLVALIMFAIVLYLSVHIIFLPLIMVYYGYGLRESFVQSIRLTSNNLKQMVIGFIVPLFVIMGAEFLLSLVTALLKRYAGITEAARYWIDYCISVVMHITIIVYLIAFDMIAFYKCSNFERRDILIHNRRN